MQIFRQKAFAIKGLVAPAIEKPSAPILLDIKAVYNINWQGSVGASSYDIERAENSNGPWQSIAINVSDADMQYTSLFHDKDAQIGKSYYYRVIAENVAGKSAPSNIVGPIHVTEQALIDDMSNFATLYTSTSTTLETGNDRRFKEDIYRMGGKKNSEAIYYVPGKLKSFRVYSFENSSDSVLTIKVSVNGANFENEKATIRSFYEAKNDYDSWYPLIYEVTPSIPNTKYVKIVFKNVAQISRVEVVYE